jgi:hypothetical protein
MSTVIVGGGGPRPQAALAESVDSEGNKLHTIVDGDEILAAFSYLEHAESFLSFIQRGE